MLRRYSRRISILVLVGLTLVVGILQMRPSAADNAVTMADGLTDQEYTLRSIAGTDALGRTLPQTGGERQNRYVGLFYFTWFGSQRSKQTEVYDITKLLRSNRTDLFDIGAGNTIAPVGASYYFNEPLYGYYSSMDPYVVRKHLELFIAAGIDFLAMDFSNAVYYADAMNVMMDIYLEYQQAGWNVPLLTFFTNTGSAQVIGEAYTNLYRDGKYDSLWFRAGGEKPLIIGWEDELPRSLREYFTVRPPQWPDKDYMENAWPYVDMVRPQKLYTNLMSVSVAQHSGGAFSFSLQNVDGGVRESWGRGYTSTNPHNGNVEAIQRGDNFQEEWDNAIAADPEIIFVTGWNEWTASKLSADWAGDTPYWVDTFNTEYSRDIEMTKARGYVSDGNGGYTEEGYGDNFYMQLIANIRAYKGLPRDGQESQISASIDIYGDDSQWDAIPNAYLNLAAGKVERASYGYVENDDYYYTQKMPVNFIRNIKVTHDSEAIYFRLETDAEIQGPEDGVTNRMNLLIGVSGNDGSQPSWENFQYVVGRYQNADGTAVSLEKVSEEGRYVFTRMDDVACVQNGNILQIRIPRNLLGMDGDKVAFCFKATDSIEHPEDIMDYYVSGDAVPMGRLVYTYGDFEYGINVAPKTGFGVWKIIGLIGGVVICAAVCLGAALGVLRARRVRKNN